jgi:hypothetical protein
LPLTSPAKIGDTVRLLQDDRSSGERVIAAADRNESVLEQRNAAQIR